MVGVLKEIGADIAAVAGQVAGATLLLSGFVVCIAAASFLTFLALGDVARGFEVARSIMSLEGFGMREGLRSGFEIVNWVSLAAIALLFAHSVVKYLRSAAHRSGAARPVIYEISSESIGLSGYGGSSAANV
jgi:hypothetical protein